MAGKLTNADMDVLETWIGSGPKTFTLLYSITKDGCVNTTFHQKCNNQGPTVTVLYNQQDSIYGGYISTHWTSNDSHQNDAYAFLFQLKHSGKKKQQKFPRTGGGYDVYCHSTYGPSFGRGPDLQTFNGTINNSGGYYALNGSSNFNSSYTYHGTMPADINNGNMNVVDLEVYKVADGERYPMLAVPWRKTPEWNEKFLEELTEDVISFKPLTDVDISAFRVLMLGPVGSGKSSFYNTINSVFRGRISQRARSGNATHSITTAYTPYSIRTRTGSNLNVRLCDTRGLEETQGLDILECNSLMDGHIPEYYEFNPAAPITSETPGFIEKPGIADKVHCVMFVIDATTTDELSTKLVEKMNSFQKIMNQKGIPQAVLLTQVDLLCKETGECVENVFKSGLVEASVDKVSKLLGVPRNNVLPVKNYENEMQLDDNISILALLALRQALYFAEDYMENLHEKLARKNKAKGGQNVKVKA